jgi:hypothetical protein
MNEFDKIGVNVIKCLQRDGRWVFEHKDQHYDMAPANLTEYLLTPLVIGADRLINVGCQQKNIRNPKSGFHLVFSENYFPNADVLFEFDEIKFDGWIYKVEELNLKGLMPGQAAWVCPYMGLYYKEPPQKLYIKMESISE